MKKWIERVVILVLVVGSVAAAYAYGIHRQNVAEQQRIEEQEQRMRKQLYYTQNANFYIIGWGGMPASEKRIYQPYSTITAEWEKDLYLDLVCYQLETGNIVTLEDVQEYLSQEYEEDGTFRLYNNGRHEEIKQFLEWSDKIGTNEGVKKEFRYIVWRDYRWAYIDAHFPNPADRTDESFDEADDVYDNLTLAELQTFVEEHYLQG